MDFFMDATKNSEEPEWLEKDVGKLKLRVWQVIFLCLAVVMSLIIMVCCCFRFRIPRTKQQIEADYQRRNITAKFRQQLETIQDAKMDNMSLKDDIFVVHTLQALELLHTKTIMNTPQQLPEFISTPPQPITYLLCSGGSLDSSFRAKCGQKPEPQVSGVTSGAGAGGMAFSKFASKVATLTKLSQPKSPTSPTPSASVSGNKIDF